MTRQTAQAGVQLNRGLVVGGGALLGVGALLGFTGTVLLGAALVAAVRRWVQQLEQPPSELAKRTWQQARAATSAGAQAWRSGAPAQSPPSQS